MHPPAAFTTVFLVSGNSSFPQSQHCSRCLRLTTSSCSLENKHVVLTLFTTEASLGEHTDLLSGSCCQQRLLGVQKTCGAVWCCLETGWCSVPSRMESHNGKRGEANPVIYLLCSITGFLWFLTEDSTMTQEALMAQRESPPIWDNVCVCFCVSMRESVWREKCDNHLILLLTEEQHYHHHE